MTDTSDNQNKPTAPDLSYLRQVLNEYLIAHDWSLPCTRGNPHTYRYIELKAANDNHK